MIKIDKETARLLGELVEIANILPDKPKDLKKLKKREENP